MTRVFLLLPTFFLASVCMGQSNETIVPGRLLVKFKPAAYEQAVQAQPAMARQGVTSAKTLSVGLATMDALNKTYGATRMVRLFPYAGKHEARHQAFGLHLWYAIVMDERVDPAAVAENYKNDAAIEWAEPMPVLKSVHTNAASGGTAALPAAIPNNAPDDPQYGSQWHYKDINVPQAWGRTTGDPRVIVGIVDSGVDIDHEDLKRNLWVNTAELNGTPGVDDDNNGFIDDIHGFNFAVGFGYLNNPAGPAQIVASEHGTHVAGTVAAATNNGKGVAGIAGGDGTSRGALLMVCQTMTDTEKSGYVTAAIAYAADNGAVILQNSWSTGQSTSIREAIKYFIAVAGNTGNYPNNLTPRPGTLMSGGLVLFSAGNDGNTVKVYPAAYDEVLAVASVNASGKRAYYSTYGDWVDISAPGGETRAGNTGGVLSTYPGNNYRWFQGTSMACPHVSGVAALTLSVFGSETYTPAMLRERLLQTANPLPNEPLYASGQMGAGLVDAFKAVSNRVPVTGVTLPSDTTVYIGRTVTLAAAVEPADATNKQVAWQSAQPAVASVDAATGVVTGHSAGTAAVTATTNDGGFTATMTVKVAPVLPDSIRLSPQALPLNRDSSTYISVRFYPTDVTDKTITWHSRNGTIATVAADGKITARALGSVHIIATAHTGEQDSCRITVVQPVAGVELLPAGVIRLVESDTVRLHARISPPDAHNKTVHWTSSSSKIATMKDSLLTAKQAGEAVITVRTDDGGFTATARVEVYEAEHVPQGFSPNGDGHNDYFVLTLDSKETYALKIFDRSGQVYFQADPYDNKWDGTANTGVHSGKTVLPGTYYYSLVGKTSGRVKTGYLIIKN